MDQKYEALFTPWKVGNVEIKNRIVMCPMGGTSLFGWFELGGCHFDKEAAKLFLERARNNVGLIIPGIAPLRDTIWGKWLWKHPKMFEELKEFMDEIHKTGAKVFIQLTAGMGRSWAITELVGPLHKNKFTRAIVKPIIDTSHELASPSPQKSRWAHDIECPEMTIEQIHEIIEAFAKTAKLCNRPGATHTCGKLDKELCTGLMNLVHKDLQLLEHLGILPEPFAPDSIPQRRNAGDDQTNVIVGPLQKQLGCFLIEMAAAQLEPAEQRGATHGTHDDAVLDLHIADLPGGKKGVVLCVHMHVSFVVIST